MSDKLFKKIRDAAKEKLSEKRFDHVISVSDTAEKLAIKYNADPKKAKLAGLAHDLYKETPDKVFINLINKGHYDPNLLKYGNAIWHGFLGADLLKKEYGIYDEEVLNAVRFHTISDPQMDKLAKIVFVADYIEPNRKFKEVIQARKIAKEDLDAAVLFEIMTSIKFLLAEGSLIYPSMLNTYNELFARNKKVYKLINKLGEA